MYALENALQPPRPPTSQHVIEDGLTAVQRSIHVADPALNIGGIVPVGPLDVEVVRGQVGHAVAGQVQRQITRPQDGASAHRE